MEGPDVRRARGGIEGGHGRGGYGVGGGGNPPPPPGPFRIPPVTTTEPSPQRDARFLTTRWSVVARASGRGEGARRGLEELCGTYWFPLYAYLRRRGNDHAGAEDLVQAFFLRLLERRDLVGLEPARGRFRSWILTCLRNFEAGEVERGRALKRGGGELPLSIDWSSGPERYAAEPATERSPEREFERAWALALIDRALESVGADYERRGRGALFEALRDELAPGGRGRPRQELAAELGLREGALKVALHRLRQRFGEALRSEVAETVAEESEVDRELAELMEVLARD